MDKHGVTNILAISIIVSGMICTVSAGPDNMSVMQVELERMNAIQEVIDANGGNWTAGETSVSELTVDAKKQLCGARIGEIPDDAQFARMPLRAGVADDITFDWRNKDGKNWMTPVKSQSSCGSCWAFSALGVIEAVIKIQANDPDSDIDLSEQHLVSKCCTAGDCGGGWPDRSLKYVRDTGVPEESCFPYTKRDCACTPCSNWEENAWEIKDYVYVTSSKDDFKSALQTYGPLSVVLTIPDDWFYYKGGVYEPAWSATDGVGWANHAVILVGWNDSDNCWIIKNSWGAGWGENGYARVKYGNLEKYNYAYAVTGIVYDEANQPPVAGASANQASGAAPLDVAFTGTGTDSDGTIASYKWTFGDGGSSTSQNPTHTYTSPGTYTATLTVTDDGGATGSDSVAITVAESANQPPVAGASANPESGAAPLDVAFTGTGTDSDGTIASYKWTFGDGGSSTSQNPTHTYTSPGTYTATLTVTDDGGATGSDSVAITVAESANQPPVAGASANQTSGAAPLDVAFTGTGSDSDGTVVSYEWAFGDGASSTSQNPTHTYTSPGTYTATLTVTDDGGATGSDSVAITAIESGSGMWVNPVAATASSYYSSTYAPTKAIDDNKATRWFTQRYDGPPCWIQFDLGSTKPISKVRAIIYRKEVPMTLDVQVSNDAANWNTVVTGFTVTEGDTFVEIPFAQTNARYIRLHETGFARMYGQCTEFDVYVGGDANQPPVAGASANQTSGAAPLNIAFTGTGSDSDGTVVSYEWTFGDGASSTSQNPTHTYTSPGTYTATLTVTDDGEVTGSDSVAITAIESGSGMWVNPVAATASSYYSSTYAPTKAIDDNKATRWFTQRYDDPPCWIQFDLGSTKPISKVRAIIYRKEVPMTLDVQVSNDATNWTTVVSGTNITEGDTFVEIPFAQTNARYIRLHETGFARMYGQCTEFDVYAHT